jgi:hypothetical protein
VTDQDKTSDDEIPRKSFFQLIPKRTFVRVAMLLVLLALVIAFQRKSAGCANQVSESLFLPQPAPGNAEGRRVRLNAPADPPGTAYP